MLTFGFPRKPSSNFANLRLFNDFSISTSLVGSKRVDESPINSTKIPPLPIVSAKPNWDQL